MEAHVELECTMEPEVQFALEFDLEFEFEFESEFEFEPESELAWFESGFASVCENPEGVLSDTPWKGPSE